MGGFAGKGGSVFLAASLKRSDLCTVKRVTIFVKIWL